jgi:transcriptional regulator with XRE-family HTH domain
MASLLNISTQAYSKLERNETTMDDNRLEKISTFSNISPEDIISLYHQNLFTNNSTEKANTQNLTNQTITNNYFGNESYYILQKTIEQQMELTDTLRQEKNF